MKFEAFEMERSQSTYENTVDFNLSESGVHPLTLAELLEGTEESVEGTLLGYPQSNGTTELRERISDLYPGSDAENVLVTNGTAEANFISALNLVEAGDEVVVMLPNYMQIWGIVRSLGAKVIPWWLRADADWSPDLAALEAAVTDKTKLIAICNPNNPTGAVMSEEAMRGICKIAGRKGAWILADEVYQGAELGEETSATFYGWYDRLIATAGLSKAYALPGLRIGWIVSDREKASELWGYKDYTSIAPSALSERLARVALEPNRRQKIIERTRSILRVQLPLVTDFVARHAAPPVELSMVPPRAGAIAWVRYQPEVSSTELTERMRKERSLLIVPGDQFDMDGYLRIGYGGEPAVVEKGLSLLSETLEEVGEMVPGS